LKGAATLILPMRYLTIGDLVKKKSITGYWYSLQRIEGTLPDVSLSAIGENYLVPKFKTGDYGGGVIDALNVIKTILLSPDSALALKAEMKKHSFWYKNQIPIRNTLAVIAVFAGAILWSRIVIRRFQLKKGKMQYNLFGGCGCVIALAFMGMFVAAFLDIGISKIFSVPMLPWIALMIGTINLLFEYIHVRSRIYNTYKDEETIVKLLSTYNSRMMITMILSPIIFILLIGYIRRKNRLSLRLIPPTEPGNWLRLNRDQIPHISEYLSKGRQEEEKIKSRSFEIWKDADSSKVKIIPWNGDKFRQFEDCPKCNFLTLGRPQTVTLKAATYSSTGLGKKVQQCVFCQFEQSFGTITLPKLVKSSSSGSSGGGRSSSSSGSWGGGSSGGGGAGGSW